MDRTTQPDDATDPDGGPTAPVVGPSLAKQRSWVAATLYGSASLLVGASLAVSWRAHTNPELAATIAGLGAAVAIAFVVVGSRVELPVWFHASSAALGSVLVAILVGAAGPTFAALYGVLILYVVAFSLYYFSLPLALAEVAFAAAAYAVALVAVPGDVPRLSYWLLVVGACGIGSGLVGVIGHRTRALLEREHAAAQQLAELDRRKDAFLRVVAHDLRGPLVSIIGNADTIASHLAELDQETVRELAERQARQGRRLDRLVGDLLDHERLRSRALHPDRRPVRIDELVARLLETFDLGDRPLQLDVAEVEVLGDATLLERAIENLLTNAVKHTPAGSAIDIVVSGDADEARLVVTDRGPGVPADQREAIFELYRSATSADDSAGIGLALVREIVRAHGGRVTVGDGHEGGASFAIVLPAPHGPGGESG